MIVATFVVLILFVMNDKKKATYKVSFDTEGGTLVATQSIEEGEKVRKPEDPTKDEYIFKGWMLNDKEYNFDTKVEKNIELKAKWEKVVKPENNTNNNNTQNNNSNNNTGSNNTQNNNTSDNLTVTAPTLSIGAGSGGIKTTAIFTIVLKGYYATQENMNTISGWELYEKVGSTYNLVEGYEVTVDIGESKTYVARAYKLNKNNKKVYSNYSNEVKIDNTTIEKPTLSKGFGGVNNGMVFSNLTIVIEGAYASDSSHISGYELYEKNGNNYTPVCTKSARENSEVKVPLGESKIYVARAYALNKSNVKVYSDYSNEVVIE